MSKTDNKINPAIENALSQGAGDSRGNLDKRVKMHETFIVGIVIVVSFGFAAMLITVGATVNAYLADKNSTSQSLRDQVKEQNDKIDALTEQLRISNEQKTN